MGGAVIENTVLNKPFEEPSRHWRFDDDGITNEIEESRRISSYFIPIPPPKKRSKQLALETAWAKEREKPNELINQVRQRVAEWRIGEYQGVTATTRQLLQYWTNRDRERRLFFCQIEALETLIYLTEVADTYGQQWIRQELRQQNEYANPGLFRLAVKMATGSGKTVVLAMVIAWQVLNKLVSPQDRRFSDAFLIISPGITIRDRLRVLFPNDPHNYYVERDIVRSAELERLQQARLDNYEFSSVRATRKA